MTAPQANDTMAFSEFNKFPLICAADLLKDHMSMGL